jgi:hypothetical protein
MFGATVEWKKKNITYVDKPTPVQERWWWLGYAGIGWPKGKQKKTKSKKENRYVIKVMRLNKEGVAVSLVRENQRMHQTFSLVHN